MFELNLYLLGTSLYIICEYCKVVGQSDADASLLMENSGKYALFIPNIISGILMEEGKQIRFG